MKTLVIHPQDRTTDFLKPIYRGLSDATIMTKDVTIDEVNEAIMMHDRVLMLGHGSPNGLFACGRFYNTDGTTPTHVINHQTAPLLRGKQNIYIWCHADQFVKAHSLTGIYSGMFISEMGEARYEGVDALMEHVDLSNRLFAETMGYFLERHHPLTNTHTGTLSTYQALSTINPIVRYNAARFYLAV